MDGTEAKNLIEDQSLAEIVQRLVKAYCPERIYLFGSRSRSDSGVHSDYDLIVVVPDSCLLNVNVAGLPMKYFAGLG